VTGAGVADGDFALVFACVDGLMEVGFFVGEHAPDL